jgi:hypothetical protein
VRCRFSWSLSLLVAKSIYVLIELEIDAFPAWPRLHGFWRTLPNYNPFTVSSEPGQDMAGAAADALLSRSLHEQEADEMVRYFTINVIQYLTCFQGVRG